MEFEFPKCGELEKRSLESGVWNLENHEGCERSLETVEWRLGALSRKVDREEVVLPFAIGAAPAQDAVLKESTVGIDGIECVIDEVRVDHLTVLVFCSVVQQYQGRYVLCTYSVSQDDGESVLFGTS